MSLSQNETKRLYTHKHTYNYDYTSEIRHLFSQNIGVNWMTKLCVMCHWRLQWSGVPRGCVADPAKALA